MQLAQYTSILETLETTVKKDDSVTAHNIARELSVIYVKLAYEKLTKEQRERQRERLLSMVDYIIKVIPDHAEMIAAAILDIAESME